MSQLSFSRRSFLGKAALVAAAPALQAVPAFAADAPASARKVSGIYLGPQAWTFNRFSALEAIEFAGRTGGTVIEFYPGQKLAKDGDAKWGHDANEDAHKRIADALAQWKITAMNYGVVGVPNEEKGARKIFDFAKRLGLYGITTESAESADLLSKLAAEYDIKVCFHNHPRQANNPNYKIWDPKYVLDLVKDRDARLGACADTGHWIRSGLNALDCLKTLRGRVHSMHLKDRVDEKGEDQIFGMGKANVVAMMEEVLAQGFKGNVSIEYETNWEHSLADVAQCVGYIRAAGEQKKW